MSSDLKHFDNLNITCKLSWVEGKSFDVSSFRYILSQYSPTIYSEIIIVVSEKSKNENSKSANESDSDVDCIRNIEMKGTKNRLIELNFVDKLYDNMSQKSYFTGPYKFIVYDYEISTVNANIALKPNESVNVTFKCIDEVFYKMTLDEKDKGYKNKKISDIVKEIVKNNGGEEEKIIDTDFLYDWTQNKINDLKMIRSLLPYAKSSSGDTLYTFFMMNNKAYFCPLTHGKNSEIKLSSSDFKNSKLLIKNDHCQRLIDLYGNIDKVKLMSNGYINDKIYKPKKTKSNFYSSSTKNPSMSTGESDLTINTTCNDDNVNQNFIDNLYNKVHMFRKIVSVTTIAIPDLTPIDSIEIISSATNSDGNANIYSGVYSILSVEYIYITNSLTQASPIMNLILCTDTEDKGQTKVEGQYIVDSSTSTISSVASTANSNSNTKKTYDITDMSDEAINDYIENDPLYKSWQDTKKRLDNIIKNEYSTDGMDDIEEMDEQGWYSESDNGTKTVSDYTDTEEIEQETTKDDDDKWDKS